VLIIKHIGSNQMLLLQPDWPIWD